MAGAAMLAGAGGRSILALAASLALVAPAGAWPRDPCPDCDDIPFQWDDGASPPFSDNPPLPQGFSLTYRVRPGRGGAPAGVLDRYAEVGAALAACWAGAATATDWREVTLRLSFRRDGSINGVPRIQHLDSAEAPGRQADLRSSFLSALDACTPLRFSPSLGQAIAGQIFAIRFIQAKDQTHG